jgi:hypothetical protein
MFVFDLIPCALSLKPIGRSNTKRLLKNDAFIGIKKIRRRGEHHGKRHLSKGFGNN